MELLAVLLCRGIGREHHLHIDIGVHVHALPGETHLGRHHHVAWKVPHGHSHVLALVHGHLLSIRRPLVRMLSQLRLSVRVGAPALILAIAV